MSNSLEFKNYGIFPSNPKWENSISRLKVYPEKKDIRTNFEKDYNKIIFTLGYRRLKHKTQVFYKPENDHISTRAEHVLIVEAIAYSISKYLGLNVELTRAIALAHDIGHAPFGHQGERILDDISRKYIKKTFWHERNGLEILDDILLLKDETNIYKNLNLTYAVRDGVISHCGEIDENHLKPREDFFNLDNYTKPNQFSPYTYEGCVVKISDKIGYLGRDIEDAISLGILDENISQLYDVLKLDIKKDKINNSALINKFINDLCQNSNVEEGLKFSDETFNMINQIKKFNYENIYFSEKVKPSRKYFELVINTIFETLLNLYNGSETLRNIEKSFYLYPVLLHSFETFLVRYIIEFKDDKLFKNKALSSINNKNNYIKLIIYFIAGMTDNYAIKMYNEIIGFGFNLKS